MGRTWQKFNVRLTTAPQRSNPSVSHGPAKHIQKFVSSKQGISDGLLFQGNP